MFLPLITTIAQKLPRKTRAELAKDVDADYYGYRDEDDGVITPLEQEEEKKGDGIQIHTAWHEKSVVPCIVTSYNP